MGRFVLLFCFFISNFAALGQEKLFTCGTKDDNLAEDVFKRMQALPAYMKRYQARTKEGEMRVCRIGIDIDSDTYLSYQKDTSAIILQVLESIEKCSKFYERETNLRLVVTQIKIWKENEPDPYRGRNNIYDLLNALSSYSAPKSNFDKHMYLYSKPITGTTETGAGIIGVANVSGMFNVSPLNDYGTMTHELGHNFGSPHTHNCFWPGGPIDYCGTIEGDCYKKSLEKTYNGTMMSYCDVPKDAAFHPLVSALIRSYAESNFTKIASIPEAPVLAKDVIIARGGIFTWPASLQAKSYQISYATNSDFSDEVLESSTCNVFVTEKMAYGKSYYLRIRTSNSSGTSSWSNAVRFIMNSNLPDLPTLLSPANGHIAPYNSSLTLSFSKVAGATRYKVQVTSINDMYFNTPSFNEYINENQYIVRPYHAINRWRVKAINDLGEGQWSSAAVFSINTTLNVGLRLPIPDNLTNAPLTLPFCYVASARSTATVTIADNQKFTNPLFFKRYTPFEIFADVAKNLPPNKKLYFRIREGDPNQSTYPPGDWLDYSFSFTTGSTKFPPGITFLNEIDQTIFGTSNPRIFLSEKHFWFEKTRVGYIRTDQENLTYENFNRTNTDGLLGVSVQYPSIQTDADLNVHFLNRGGLGQFRQIQLNQGNPDSTANVSEFSSNYIWAGFIPEHKLYWTSFELYRLFPNNIGLLKSVNSGELINQVKLLNNKVVVLVSNFATSRNDILTFDINNPSSIQTYNGSTVPGLQNIPSQIEVGFDGKLWIRQGDSYTNQNSVAMLDGQTWKFFNAPQDYSIASLAVSLKGDIYILCIGKESRIFKFDGSGWLKTDLFIPLEKFGNKLWVDKNENFWISSFYGLVKLTSCPPVPTLTGVKNEVSYEEIVEFKSTNCLNGSSWSWINDNVTIKDSLIATGGSLKLTMKLPTQFQVKCSGKVCTENDTTFSVLVRPLVTGISQQNDESLLNIYPNPSSDKIRINCSRQIKAGSRFYLSDSKGVKVKSFQISNSSAEIDISHLETGVYIIWTRKGNQKISKKFTKL